MDMTVTFPGGAKVASQFKGFTIVTDQPEYAGGEGSAPAPFDTFLSSLGTCAGFYVLAFCLARDIDTEGLALTLTFDKNPEKKMISRVNIKIALPPAFPDKYRKAVVKAAEACAVVKHILDPPEFVVSAAE